MTTVLTDGWGTEEVSVFSMAPVLTQQNLGGAKLVAAISLVCLVLKVRVDDMPPPSRWGDSWYERSPSHDLAVPNVQSGDFILNSGSKNCSRDAAYQRPLLMAIRYTHTQFRVRGITFYLWFGLEGAEIVIKRDCVQEHEWVSGSVYVRGNIHSPSKWGHLGWTSQLNRIA